MEPIFTCHKIRTKEKTTDQCKTKNNVYCSNQEKVANKIKPYAAFTHAVTTR